MASLRCSVFVYNWNHDLVRIKEMLQPILSAHKQWFNVGTISYIACYVKYWFNDNIRASFLSWATTVVMNITLHSQGQGFSQKAGHVSCGWSLLEEIQGKFV